MGFCSFASTFPSFSAGVQLLCEFSSSVLSHQREIRVNSPFTFVYEETPLHCRLRPPPLLTTRPRSGRKQGQKGCHVWGSSNMADPWSSRTKSLCQQAARIQTRNSLCVKNTDSDIVSSGGCFRQPQGCHSPIHSDCLGNTLEYFSRHGAQNVPDSH